MADGAFPGVSERRDGGQSKPSLFVFCVVCGSEASAVAGSLTDVCLGRRPKIDHKNVVWGKQLLSTGSNRETKLYRTRLMYSRESGAQSAGSPVGFAHGSGRDRCFCAVVGLAV